MRESKIEELIVDLVARSTIELVVANLATKRVKELDAKDKSDKKKSERDTIKFRLKRYV